MKPQAPQFIEQSARILGALRGTARQATQAIGPPRLLRHRSERPCDTRAHKRDKLAPPHTFPPPCRDFLLATMLPLLLRASQPAHVCCGSFSTEAADSAARPTSASPRKLTSGHYKKIGRDGPIGDVDPVSTFVRLRHVSGATYAPQLACFSCCHRCGAGSVSLPPTRPATGQPRPRPRSRMPAE